MVARRHEDRVFNSKQWKNRCCSSGGGVPTIGSPQILHGGVTVNRTRRIVVGTAIALAIWGSGAWEKKEEPSAGPCDIVSGLPGVCLDPGHGGPNAGKLRLPDNNGDGENNNAGSCGPVHIAPDTCVNEAWVNHEIVPMVAGDLRAYTHVGVTRQAITQDITYRARCDAANLDSEVDVFISVHHEGNTAVYDTRTYYYAASPMSDWSYELAEALADKIDDQFHYGKQVKTATFYVLMNTWMPSALTEASCIGHVDEALLMASEDDSHRSMEADGIANGLFVYAYYDVAPPTLLCIRPSRFSPGHKLYWSSVPGADGYVLYYDFYASWYECPPTEQTVCIDFHGATSCTLYSVLGLESAVSVRPYVEYPPEDRYFMGGVSNCVAPWHDTGCFGTAIDRDITGFYATGGPHADSLFWHAISFEEWAEFEIWRSADGGYSYDDSVGCVGYDPMIEDYSFIDTSTAYWLTYYYKIRDTEGYVWWGPASARPSSGVIIPPELSPVPVCAIDRIDDQLIHLCLEQGSQYADHYSLSLKPEGGAWSDTVWAGESWFDVGALQNGTSYCFCIRGVNVAGSTDSSTMVWAVPMPKPSDLVDEAGNECIRLWWNGNPHASGYTVYYSTSQSNPWQSSVDVGDTTATTLTDLENGTLYYLCVVAYDQFGNETGPSNSVSARPECWAGIENPPVQLTEFHLGCCRPNPFNSSTSICYQLAGPCQEVRLVVYDTEGREVRTIVDEGQPPGIYEVRWDGRDDVGRTVCPGVYFFRIDAGVFSRTSKVLCVR
ncbi:MAG: N-acetylmuramoyl-L-alanine amidase [Candidatus Eisenbacteria bacterium]